MAIIDNWFTEKTETFYSFLKTLQSECNTFDDHNPSIKTRQERVLKIFESVSAVFDLHFSEIWKFITKERLSDSLETFNGYKSYYYDKLSKFLLSPAVNFQINKKPLGYPGDFIVMNYMYDYNPTTGKFLGESTFDMLVNRYSCNVPISMSNIKRKEFLKEKLYSVIKQGGRNIASIACGSIRELFEATRQYDIPQGITFTCFDFEQKVFDYIEDQIKKNDLKGIKLEMIRADIMGLIKDKNMQERLSGQDFVYCSGLFDYLSERISERLLKILFSFVKPGGELIICNASEEYSSHRAYYDFLGDWILIYRKKDQIMRWTKNLPDISESSIFQTHEGGNYWFLSLKK
ncbi:MAG: class I SAM-dependent methyltransferase [Candidatus Margulisiibacteriota bacterium]